MTVNQPKKWLLLGALVLLFPVFSVAKPPKGCGIREKCRQVPDGGSTLNYLLAAGATCLGAIAVRSRFNKSTNS